MLDVSHRDGARDRRTDAALTIVRLFRALERVDSGLTPQQYRVLKLIGTGGERSARLAEKLAVAKPTPTSTADGLAAAGLLYREADTADRRVVRLRLTSAGQAAADRAGSVYSDWLDQLLEASGEPSQYMRRGLAAAPGQPSAADRDQCPVAPEKKTSATQARIGLSGGRP